MYIKVAKEQIVLTIYAPNVGDLSLVDLPGFVRLAETGQNDDEFKPIKV